MNLPAPVIEAKAKDQHPAYGLELAKAASLDAATETDGMSAFYLAKARHIFGIITHLSPSLTRPS